MLICCREITGKIVSLMTSENVEMQEEFQLNLNGITGLPLVFFSLGYLIYKVSISTATKGNIFH